jgi:hypothetical protein
MIFQGIDLTPAQVVHKFGVSLCKARNHQKKNIKEFLKNRLLNMRRLGDFLIGLA